MASRSLSTFPFMAGCRSWRWSGSRNGSEAMCQPWRSGSATLTGLGTDGAIERFKLPPGEDFPLNLKTCSVVFPPGDWPEQEVLFGLSRSGDQVCLILTGNPRQQANLRDRCRTPDN